MATWSGLAKRGVSLVLGVLLAAVAAASPAAASGGPPTGTYVGPTNQSLPGGHGRVVLGVEAPVAVFRSGHKGCASGCTGEIVDLSSFWAALRGCRLKGGVVPGAVPPLTASGFASFKDGYIPVRGAVTIRADGSFAITHLTGSYGESR